MSSLKERMKEKQWRNDILIFPDCPRTIAAAAFLLSIGHDHPCRFLILDSPTYPLCGSGATMNADHVPSAQLARRTASNSDIGRTETL
ncbi:hypothetical protein NPIL_8321 [Nephila pilipes]|uniref:Uncharacterized protein n=1 Tax=Nephila pilipes TaxID=299642 RepID=A0A8X6QEH8_NEPPI|nr:hypothetical protein NPIL_227941 [Nephila pilipes]GFU21077.1 hypothetical protein NPIL_8321 [Nephila pilipes]